MSRLLIVVLLLVTALPVHAAAYQPDPPDVAARKYIQQREDIRRRLYGDDTTQTDLVQSGRAPANFRAVVDKALAAQLTDPPSRRVAFLSRPGPGGICGTVNSKNRMGGYVGATPFYGLFDSQGQMVRLHIFQGSMYDINTGSSPTDMKMLSECHFFGT